MLNGEMNAFFGDRRRSAKPRSFSAVTTRVCVCGATLELQRTEAAALLGTASASATAKTPKATIERMLTRMVAVRGAFGRAHRHRNGVRLEVFQRPADVVEQRVGEVETEAVPHEHPHDDHI